MRSYTPVSDPSGTRQTPPSLSCRGRRTAWRLPCRGVPEIIGKQLHDIVAPKAHFPSHAAIENGHVRDTCMYIPHLGCVG